MTKRLDDPEVQPIYQLEQSLDVIDGLVVLQVEAEEIAQQYPDDTLHFPIKLVAAMSVYHAYLDEAERATHFRQTIAENRVETRLNATLGTRREALTNLTQRVRDVEITKRSTDQLFSGILSEADDVERAVISRAAERKLEAAKEALKLAETGVIEVDKSIQAARSINRRKTAEVKKPIDKEFVSDTPDVNMVTSDILREFLQAAKRLEAAGDTPMAEHDLVRNLYPELYRTNRPAAFALIDQIFDGSGAMDLKIWRQQLSGIYLQRGRLFKATQSGKPSNNSSSNVYRRVWSGHDVIINSKGGFQQRLEVDGLPHVILWDCVVPPVRTRE